jgi:hypothetical protein
MPAIVAGIPKVMIADTHRKRILGHFKKADFYAGSTSCLKKQGRVTYPLTRKPERLLAFPRW